MMAIKKLNLSGHFNQELSDLGYIFPGTIQVDVTDPETPAKVVGFLRNLIESGDVVYVALPGLTFLSAITLTAIQGISGNFPFLVTLVRDADGKFVPSEPLDLQDFRNNVARANREQVIVL